MDMTMKPEDIGGNETTARRLLVLARSIAPCIDTFEDDTEQKLDAVAVLQGVIDELPEPGTRRAKSLSRNGTAMTLAEIQSAFDSDSRASLRALCGMSRSSALPLGSFPTSPALGKLWPEEQA